MEVRFFAGAAEAAGVDSLEIDASGRTADEVVAELSGGNERLAKVLGVSALLADGTRINDRSADLSGVAALDVLPPFAGG
ncbi:MAG: MoaD/ThiS family protein [Propionibacteriaceae bacterium]|nr:MoaD/ThiS family protein [Propionibacteriaceae bacterium]